MGAPHPRGDGPHFCTLSCLIEWCSPPAWGWSAGRTGADQARGVLPTRVGMVRSFAPTLRTAWSAPHPRGDGPPGDRGVVKVPVCSPPAWGWSGLARKFADTMKVLPTRVGMVRLIARGSIGFRSAPHPRGDGPTSIWFSRVLIPCSPPAWGWSARAFCEDNERLVLPTRVGMVRTGAPAGGRERSAPHPRGDGPTLGQLTPEEMSCSPPAWGWSAINGTLLTWSAVLPTRVGMVRPASLIPVWSPCAPHPRGDGPTECLRCGGYGKCSPPAWGWSGGRE